MTDRVLSRSQVRRVDTVAIQRWGVSGLVLMENAGRGVVDHLVDLGVAGRILVVCAKGNNGGDGFVIARHLHLRGYRVQVLLCCHPDALIGDAAANFSLLRRTSVAIHLAEGEDLTEAFEGVDWIVDALLGTGSVGAPREPLASVIATMNAAPARRYAVDLPSGLDCDTGQTQGLAVRADFTGTFVAEKTGFKQESALPWLGQVQVLDIGLPWELVQEAVQVDMES